MPSTIVNCMKASFLHYARGVKQTFSSSASNNHKFTLKAEMAAKQAQDAARKPKIPAHEITERDVDITKGVVAFGSLGWICTLSNDDNSGSNKGSKCNCQCRCSNVKQD